MVNQNLLKEFQKRLARENVLSAENTLDITQLKMLKIGFEKVSFGADDNSIKKFMRS